MNNIMYNKYVVLYLAKSYFRQGQEYKVRRNQYTVNETMSFGIHINKNAVTKNQLTFTEGNIGLLSKNHKQKSNKVRKLVS